jgi:T5SS/PEP-CTERM-associated repeat protein
MTVGNEGTGSLTLLAGGSASSGAGVMRVGDGFLASGSVTVDGTGSSLTRLGETVIGNFGAGDLTVSNGGTLGTARLKLADEIGSTGNASVTGPGATWTDSVEIFVGDGGVGTLDVTNGGTVSGLAGTIGDDLGSNGTATVSGSGSSWSSGGSLTVGDAGTGVLIIEDGAMASGSSVTIGFAPGSTGSVSIRGDGSALVSTGTVQAGLGGPAALTIENGAAVETEGSYIQSSGAALELVIGPDSTGAAAIEALTASLNGSLLVTLASGYTPPGGTTVTVVSAASVTGTFLPATLPAGATITYSPTAVTLTFDGEPGLEGDVNGDGVVDVQDLIEVITGWGPCKGDCAADLNGDGIVDVQDLVTVILNWS